MRVVPRNPVERILFYQLRAPKWAEQAGELGMPTEMVGELDDALVAAKDAYAKQYAAQQAARTATARLHASMKRLSKSGSGLIQCVRAKAGRDRRSPVYTEALVPMPKKKSRIAPPGTPDNFSVKLVGMGWVEVRWKCPNPRGSVSTMYRVERQINYTGPFKFAGVVNKKRFIDRGIPKGAASVTYRVTPERSTCKGPAALYTISFGNEAGGRGPEMHIKSRNATPVLLAAPIAA